MLGWDHVELTSVARQSLSQALTDLKIDATPACLHRNIPDLLSDVISREMHAAVFSAIMRCIGARWATTLRHLNILRIAGSHDDLAPLEAVTSLQSIPLKHILHEPLSDARVLSIIRALINLRTLEIDVPGAEADVAFLRCLAEH
ncbi:hypothetical protein K438DRAFT_1972267 [Mycena galopus ATCC 62051]|nr:hypothetical protein K438DRAFT_1972267 [Mycena galopus ATCC 62051]